MRYCSKEVIVASYDATIIDMQYMQNVMSLYIYIAIIFSCITGQLLAVMIGMWYRKLCSCF